MIRKARHAVYSVPHTPERHAWPSPILAFLFFLFLVPGITAFTLSNVHITPGRATTVDDLICLWDLQGTANINVTWLNNSVLFNLSSNVQGSASTLDNSRTARGETWTCTVSAGDDSDSQTQSFSAYINNSNPSPPGINNQTLFEDIPWTGLLTSSDPDGDPVSFFCLPSNVLDSCSDNGQLAWTPLSVDVEPAQSKQYNLSFYATDGQGGVSVTAVNFNVTAVNDPPSFSTAIGNQVISEGQALHYLISLTDEENASGPFNFSVFSNYSTERINYTTADQRNFFIQFYGNRAANYSDVGNKTINVTACDPRNGTLCISSKFNLEVKPVNHPPILAVLQNLTGMQGQPFIMSINATDVDGDNLSFSIDTDCGFNPWNFTYLTVPFGNASALINTTLSNDQVRCHNMTVHVTDHKGEDSQTLSLNLINVNDPPRVFNWSSYGGNTLENRFINNITAYAGSRLAYLVNATDPDIGIDPLERITYLDNSSLCGGNCPLLEINNETGLIDVRIPDSFSGNYTYNISVHDVQGFWDSTLLVLHLISNGAPFFVAMPNDTNATEDQVFEYPIYGSDPEGHPITYTADTSMFNISDSGLINFTPLCGDYGMHNITVTLWDDVNATAQASFMLDVFMVYDKPVFGSIENLTILKESRFRFNITNLTYDEDLLCGPGDSLRFSSSFLSGRTLFNISPDGMIDFIPDVNSQGNYLVNLSVIDLGNLTDSVIWNFTVVNLSNPPIIQNVTPYGAPFSFDTVFDWITLSMLGPTSTDVSFLENTVVVFDENSIDPENDTLAYNWTIDGGFAGSEKNLSINWTYDNATINRSGFNISFHVYDLFHGEPIHDISFNWNATIVDVNRPPQLNQSLPNVTVHGTLSVGGYFTGDGWNEIRFYDADGDELTFNSSPTNNVTIVIENDTITFIGKAIGVEEVYFYANDTHGGGAISNLVVVNVTEIETDQSQSITITQRGGTSNKNQNSNPQYIPFSVIQEVEKEKDTYLDIIVPEPVTFYQNNTIREVIKLVNHGNNTLKGIRLSVESNYSDALVAFEKDFFSVLEPKQSETTEVIITPYKQMNHYEVIIWANVTDPSYKDKAVIYLNAIEKTKGNQSVASTKITFAEDLLASNPECLELNEYIRKAKSYMDQQDYESASQILDQVIQGCKYLLGKARIKDERPQGLVLGIDLDSSPYIKPGLIGLSIFAALIVFLTLRLKKSNDST